MTERKFTDEEVQKIREDFDRGQKLLKQIVSLRDIAKKYPPISSQHASRFHHGVNVREINKHLTNEQKEALRKDLEEHYRLEREYQPLSATEIGKRYGVTAYTIQKIAGYRTYKNVGKVRKDLTKEQAVEIAMELIPKGSCTHNALIKKGLPNSNFIYEVINEAEAKFVNRAMSYFPPPPNYEELHNEHQ